MNMGQSDGTPQHGQLKKGQTGQSGALETPEQKPWQRLFDCLRPSTKSSKLQQSGTNVNPQNALVRSGVHMVIALVPCRRLHQP